MSENTSSQRELRFEFGRNWQSFVRRKLDDERIGIARDHILSFLKRKDLNGLDFLDIGCGSGIHSAAAKLAGASRIQSFDYDPNSVAATEMVRTRINDPGVWQVRRGDVLDDAFVQSLGKWNFVYSWGVLHHTGDVWRAIDNASKAVADDGIFYIALYSADVEPTPDFWLRIKREYNQASSWKKERMVWWYVWNYSLNRSLRQIPSFIKRTINYRRSRGMSMFVDIRDWLGGWPMEYTRDADVIAFLEKRGFKLENIKTGEANTEFLFAKRN
jgi:2-polyprenyl-6-hydroxyphenyl methylase/3-demethylubiquinone-9 3-methyltransferase